MTRLYRHDNAPVFEVVVGGAKITATPQHPFWVAGQGWVTVDRLLPGDRLVQPDDTTVSVESVRDTGTAATVYNFEVEGAHDYYVQAGTHWILVHNECGEKTLRSGSGGNPKCGRQRRGAGATILHGLDLVSAREPGLLRHADADAESEFIVDQAELVQRCTEWLAKFRD